MARGFYDKPYIASGYNNAANMKRLHLLDTTPDCENPLFHKYSDFFDIRFFQNEGTQRTGDRRQVPIGLPFAEWEFPLLTDLEYLFLANNFASNRLDGEVTIRTYDYENDAWNNYNAIMSLNTQDRGSAWNGFEWKPFIIRFTDLRIVT